ncbi:tripartite motif-containing protein 16-like protein isoform X2 [Alosa pseudoharengus]|uniref:tripartite motif-containing protein 16-like protein isoform X2 n=1 Tax=Alosa pseudoharengus TaxID=34774 RepID=UPI003F89D10C
MAEAISINQEDLFICPICLDLLKDPVSLNCGHNYCTGCIKGCWDQEDQKGVYSCPQCRQTFTPRPVLNKNNFIAELVEQFRKTRIQGTARPTPQCFAGPGDVACDSCTGRKLKADKICAQHQRLLEVFCRTDQSCVCVLCLVDEHKGHDTVSAAAERSEKQKEMEETKRKLQQRLQERKKELLELRKAVETLKSSAQTAVEDSERIFTEMIRSIERRRSEVTELIRAQEKAEVSWSEGLLKQLEQEIAELKRRDAELEQLSHTDDHIHFLKNFQSVVPQPQSKDLSSTSVSQSWSFEAVKKSVSTLKGQLEDFFKQEVMKISAAVSDVQTVFTEPVTREEFLKYSCHFTLDPNTAHRHLHLSEGNKRVEWRNELQSYPDHPERFDEWNQVLCREGVSGRCYWEFEWSGQWCYIAVSYKSISRNGVDVECGFGYNDQSWRLELYSSSFNSSSSRSYFRHNNKHTNLPLVASSRIGVYLDHRAGTLAFYSISDTMTLLHRVQTTFTQPLYPGFLVDIESPVTLL